MGSVFDFESYWITFHCRRWEANTFIEPGPCILLCHMMVCVNKCRTAKFKVQFFANSLPSIRHWAKVIAWREHQMQVYCKSFSTFIPSYSRLKTISIMSKNVVGAAYTFSMNSCFFSQEIIWIIFVSTNMAKMCWINSEQEECTIRIGGDHPISTCVCFLLFSGPLFTEIRYHNTQHSRTDNPSLLRHISVHNTLHHMCEKCILTNKDND